MLCNRSVAHLKSSRPAAALTDAERARSLGAGRAHYRLGEALASLGFLEDALEAYGAALANAAEGDKAALRDRIAAAQHGGVRVTPEDFARKLHGALAGSTLLLAPGRSPQALNAQPSSLIPNPSTVNREP